MTLRNLFIRSARTILALLSVCLLAAGTCATVVADPLESFLTPAQDPSLAAATPLGEPWFDPPPGFESATPGAVLNTRIVNVGPLITPVASTQILFRTNDSKDQPVAGVTTVIVPTAPWTGKGSRPVVAYNMAIDSLGNTCAPSWTLPRGIAPEIAAVQLFLAKNYAVVVTDHQGPRQAYAAGRMAGHAVLDALRAMVNLPQLGLPAESPIAITGYSGGAIASGWAAQLAPSYAPDVNLVGTAFGGAPIDYRILLGSMNGNNAASTLFLSAAMGVAREYPEMFQLMNANGLRLAQIAKDMCVYLLAPGGLVAPIPVQALSDVPDVDHTPIAEEIIRQTRMGGDLAPSAPVFIYQGQQEFWVPREGAERLYDEWCAHGATVRLEEYVGEHIVVAVSGLPGSHQWIDDRLAGIPAPEGCSSFGR
ncbi:lipase family protein [Rhodococcus sp. G-MC3]|uniref:lipase family protein n=1 Tax=Rhodococcus sp. G-MC3 TaxID=3046209 RepID=UPI0024BBBE49|nr:lipase family protein [Rhodococcus sp. G-MC3]MDJ0392633.1 lipase family protein [Rhodococcus sp. G-MC3]